MHQKQVSIQKGRPVRYTACSFVCKRAQSEIKVDNLFLIRVIKTRNINKENMLPFRPANDIIYSKNKYPRFFIVHQTNPIIIMYVIVSLVAKSIVQSQSSLPPGCFALSKLSSLSFRAQKRRAAVMEQATQKKGIHRKNPMIPKRTSKQNTKSSISSGLTRSQRFSALPSRGKETRK